MLIHHDAISRSQSRTYWVYNFGNPRAWDNTYQTQACSDLVLAVAPRAAHFGSGYSRASLYSTFCFCWRHSLTFSPRSHMHTGASVNASQRALCLSGLDWCIFVYLTAETALASPPRPPRPRAPRSHIHIEDARLQNMTNPVFIQKMTNVVFSLHLLESD